MSQPEVVYVEALSHTRLRVLNADGTEQVIELATGDTLQLGGTKTEIKRLCQDCGHSRLAHVEWIQDEDGDFEVLVPCRDCDCPAWMDFTPLRGIT